MTDVATFPLPASPMPTAPMPTDPFPGIGPYGYAERAVFFARKDETRRLSRSIVLQRGVLLFAASGIGKSSLVNAGLLREAMEEGFQPERVRVQPRPGQEMVLEPIRDGYGDAAPVLPSLFSDVHDSEGRAILSVDGFLERVRERSVKERPLFIFDQFEEWVTLFQEGDAQIDREQLVRSREKIKNALTELLNNSALHVKVLMVFREDYLANLAPIFRDSPTLPDHYLRLLPLTAAQVNDVIRGPFDQYKGHYRPEISVGLAAEIAREFERRAMGGDIQLTEVQIVCRTLLERAPQSDGDAGVEELYQSYGGVQGILEHHLEGTLNALEPAQREPAIAVLSRLITSSGTRNVVSEDNLLRWLEADGLSTDQVRGALRNLESQAKLIRSEPRRGQDYFEISSEFLVDWIRKQAAEREKAAHLRKFRDQVKRENKDRWSRIKFASVCVLAVLLMLIAFGLNRHGQTEAKLYWEARADALALESFQSKGDVAGLLASQAYVLHKQRGDNESPGRLASALAAALEPSRPVWSVSSGALSALSSDSGSQTIAAVTDDRVLVWDLRQGSGSQSFRQKFAAPKELRYPSTKFASVALSSDGKSLGAGGADGRVILWNLTTPQVPPRQTALTGSKILSMSLSSTGERLASSAYDSVVRVWNTSHLDVPAYVLRSTQLTWSVKLSPDGRMLFAGGFDGKVRVWRLEHQAILVDTLPGVSVALSSDGRFLAAGALTGEVRIWQMNNLSRQASRYVGSHLDSAAVVSLGFSPDGSALASGDAKNVVRLWHLDMPGSQNVSVPVGEQDGWPTGIAFTSDGTSVLTAGRDGSVRQWMDVRGPDAFPAVIGGFPTDVSSAAFSVQGRTVAAIAAPKDLTTLRRTSRQVGLTNAWVRGLDANHEAVEVEPGTTGFTAVTVSKDGRTVASATASRVYVSRIASSDSVGARLTSSRVVSIGLNSAGNRSLSADSGISRSLAISNDGQFLAAGVDDGTVRVWQLSKPRSPPIVLEGNTDWTRSVAFSPDGLSVASGGDDSTVRVWRFREGTRPLTELRGHQGYVFAVVFSLGGELASGGEDGTIRLWNLKDSLASPLILQAPGVTINALAFSGDGSAIAAGGTDGSVRIWSLLTGSSAVAPLVLTTRSAVRSVALSTNGDTVFAVNADGLIHRWEVRIEVLARMVCRRVARNLSADEWRGFLPPATPYEKTCPDFPVHPTVLQEARMAFRRGLTDSARNILKTLNKLDPSRPYDAEKEELFSRADSLARAGNVDSTIVVARQAVARFPQRVEEDRASLEGVAAALVRRISLLADSLKPAELLASINKAASLGQNSDSVKQQFLTGHSAELEERVVNAVREGRMDEARSSLSRLRILSGDSGVSVNTWNSLCWYGSLWGHAAEVMTHCESAVLLSPEDVNIRDSRGLARALTGNRLGAIDDFTSFIGSKTQTQALKAVRRQWIAALRSGRNPFTVEELDRLRKGG